MNKPIENYLFLKVNIYKHTKLVKRDIDVLWKLPSEVFKFSVGKDYLPVTLIYNKNGCLNINTPADNFTLNDNSSLILNNGTPFEIFPSAGYSSNILFVYFSEKFLIDIYGFRGHNLFEKVFMNDKTYSSVLPGILNNFEECREDRLYFDEKYTILTKRLTDNQKQIDNEIRKLKFKRSLTSSEIFRKLNRSIEYIDSCYNKNIGLQEISREATISKFHLVRLFKELFNTTPYNYLVSKRIKKAKELLVSSNSSVFEICNSVGYESLSTFTSVFKKFTGYPPAYFRRINQGLKKAI